MPSMACNVPLTFASVPVPIGGGGKFNRSIQPAKAYEDISVMLSGAQTLGLTDNGQYKSTNRLLVVVPIRSIIEKFVGGKCINLLWLLFPFQGIYQNVQCTRMCHTLWSAAT